MRQHRRPVARAAALMIALALGGACGSQSRKLVELDRVAKLKRDLDKVRFAIRTTKTLVSRARGADYLPDLYNRLAELYVEQARYHWQIAQERQKKRSRGVVSVQARLLKNEAIRTYRRLLALFPDYPDADKVWFFMAHEMRELGQYQEMLKTLQELVDKFPKSRYRLEGLLVLGDYYFDKSQLVEAAKYYQMVLESPETRVHAMARYKLAWVKINKAEYKNALELFEGSIAAARKFAPETGGQNTPGAKGGKIDLRREALVDSVFCYTEVHKPDGALTYFRNRADAKTTYLAALDKLGNRYYIKAKWKASAMVYREILSLTGNVEDAVEYAHRLFESVTRGKLYDHGAEDVAAIVRVLRRRYYDATLSKKKRKALYTQFEKYARYIGTKLQDIANAKDDQELFVEAADAYEAYLTFFADDKHAPAIRSNLAEALYSAKRFLDAGHYYELAARNQRGKDHRESIYTAVVAYFEALKLTGKKRELSRLDVVRARAGLRRAGRIYIRKYAKAEHIREVKFNIARTYYDAGEFDEAIRLFTAFVEQFTGSDEATVGAHLVLDSYRSREDYQGLIDAGKRFLRMSGLGGGNFRTEVAEIIKGAENALLSTETLKASDEEAGSTDSLERIARKYKGTKLGEKALLNAFVTARNAKDPEKVFEVGEQLIRSYPRSEKLPDVLATMGKLALDSLQYSRGATYLEAAARRKQGGEALKIYQSAFRLRVRLGDRRKAERDLAVLLRSSVPPAEKASMAVDVARLQIEANDVRAIIGVLKRAQAAGASSAQLSYLLGYALFRQGQLAEAQKHLSQAVEIGASGSDSEREAAAAAQFYLGEIAFKAFEQVQLSSDLNKMGASLQQKLGLMATTRQAYTAAAQLRSANWTVAALGRLASVDQSAAKALLNLQLPPDLPANVVQQLKGQLAAQAKPLQAEAKQALQQCASSAKKFKVLSEAARACLGGRAPSADPLAGLKVPAVERSRPKGVIRLQKKLASNPRDLKSIALLGAIYLKHGDPYMARMILGKGIELRETATMYNLIGVASARLGDYDEAYSLFEKALNVKSDYSRAHLNMAALLSRFGHSKTARSEARKAKRRSFKAGDPGLLPDAMKLAGGGGA